MKLYRLSDVFSVKVDYSYTRNGYFYFQRAVPSDLVSRFGRRVVKKALGTSSAETAAKLVEKLNATLEADWRRLRENPDLSPVALSLNAERLLDDWGLRPRGEGRNDPSAVDAFRDQLGDGSGRDEDLRPVERAALGLLYEGRKPTLSDALDFYLQTHPKGADENLKKVSTIAVTQFNTAVGEIPFAEISREHVRTWMSKAIESKQSQGTIRRRLNSLGAIASVFIREKELDISNRFEKHTIPASAKGAKERVPFTVGQIKTIQAACVAKGDDMRILAAMLSDSCSRLAEIAGLRLDDIVLDGLIPYVRIVEHPGRSLKTPDSARSVPLVGAALWAAKRVVTNSNAGQVFAFPRYIKNGVCDADAASAALNKWVRSLKIDNTTHAFRHTMADRLREVGCPKDVRDQIGGWSREDMSQKYGAGHSLKVMHEWLTRVVVADTGGA